MLTPHTIKQETDRAQWREDVKEWMKTVNDCTEGGDKRTKVATETLSMLLYRSFHVGDKEMAREAIICGKIL